MFNGKMKRRMEQLFSFVSVIRVPRLATFSRLKICSFAKRTCVANVYKGKRKVGESNEANQIVMMNEAHFTGSRIN